MTSKKLKHTWHFACRLKALYVIHTCTWIILYHWRFTVSRFIKTLFDLPDVCWMNLHSGILLEFIYKPTDTDGSFSASATKLWVTSECTFTGESHRFLFLFYRSQILRVIHTALNLNLTVLMNNWKYSVYILVRTCIHKGQ